MWSIPHLLQGSLLSPLRTTTLPARPSLSQVMGLRHIPSLSKVMSLYHMEQVTGLCHIPRAQYVCRPRRRPCRGLSTIPPFRGGPTRCTDLVCPYFLLSAPPSQCTQRPRRRAAPRRVQRLMLIVDLCRMLIVNLCRVLIVDSCRMLIVDVCLVLIVGLCRMLTLNLSRMLIVDLWRKLIVDLCVHAPRRHEQVRKRDCPKRDPPPARPAPPPMRIGGGGGRLPPKRRFCFRARGLPSGSYQSLGRRWSSNPSGKCSYERPTRGTVCGTKHVRR